MYVTKFSTATLVARVRLQPSFVSRTRRRRRCWRASSVSLRRGSVANPSPLKTNVSDNKNTRFHGKTLWFRIRNSLVRVLSSSVDGSKTIIKITYCNLLLLHFIPADELYSSVCGCFIRKCLLTCSNRDSFWSLVPSTAVRRTEPCVRVCVFFHVWCRCRSKKSFRENCCSAPKSWVTRRRITNLWTGSLATRARRSGVRPVVGTANPPRYDGCPQRTV